MRKHEVRDADARERTNEGGKKTGPPAHAWSNRVIADGLFAVLGDFYALEREAFRREYDAMSRSGAGTTSHERAQQ